MVRNLLSSVVVVVILAYIHIVINGVETAPLNPNTLQRSYYTVTAPDHTKPYIEARNATYHGHGPREEARAMCSVKTQEVNATANATITRRLHGVVTSRELHNAIQRLEVIIFGQMQQLWQSLDALRSHLTSNNLVQYPDRRSFAFQYKPNTG